MKNRVDFKANGKLDEVVTNGGAHLEHLDRNRWFLNCVRSDGSSFAVWISGKVTSFEEREKPNRK
ncbi:MAG: hypothetical protein AAF986_05580 [Pseudomonadota bacterium]